MADNENYRDYLLQQNEDKPWWIKEKIMGMRGLEGKRERPSTEPSWKKNAFGQSLRESVMRIMIEHGNGETVCLSSNCDTEMFCS
jgi:hypothetical protein